MDTYGIVVAAFSVVDKANWVKFFENTFLVANVSSEIVFKMPFLILSSANVDFSVWEFQWRTYTTKEAFFTTRYIKLVGKKEFAVVAFFLKYETYVVYVASLGSTSINVHPSWRPQLFGLITKETFTKVLDKYTDFADVFSLNLASKLPEHTKINDYAIKLVNGQ